MIRRLQRVSQAGKEQPRADGYMRNSIRCARCGKIQSESELRNGCSSLRCRNHRAGIGTFTAREQQALQNIRDRRDRAENRDQKEETHFGFWTSILVLLLVGLVLAGIVISIVWIGSLFLRHWMNL